MWNIVSSLFASTQAKIMIVLTIAVLAYIGVLHLQISAYEAEIAELQENLTACTQQNTQLRTYMDNTMQYYRERKGLDLKPSNELTEDELKLH